MDFVLNNLSGVLLKQPIRGDDFVDRLHYFVTVAILAMFAIGAGLQEYVGKPIDCWTPMEFPSGSESYHQHINSYCWTHQLHYPTFPRDSVLTNKTAGFLDWSKPHPLVDFGTAFFRWVTLIFIFQACLFKIPNFLWQRLSTASGADLEKIRDLVVRAQIAETDEAKKLKMDEVVAYFENWITGYRSYRIRFAGKYSSKLLSVLFCLGKKSGNYLSSMYLTVKILNVINVVGNLILLAVFLDLNFWKYGLIVLNSVFTYGDWQDPYNFPRLLICDFVLEGGQEINGTVTTKPQIYQIQCTMSLNLLLEKIFVLEWFWLIFLFIVSFTNMVSWGCKIKPPCSTILFSKSYIKSIDPVSTIEIGLLVPDPVSSAPKVPLFSQKGFIEDYLRSDAVFIIRMLELNADKAIVGDIVRHLWDRYLAMNRSKNSVYSLDNRLSKEDRDNAKMLEEPQGIVSDAAM